MLYHLGSRLRFRPTDEGAYDDSICAAEIIENTVISESSNDQWPADSVGVHLDDAQ